MTPLELADVLTGTGGDLRGRLPDATRFPRIERDARRVTSGDLFIAIRGERFDGHQFVADAAANGAAAALVGREWAAAQREAPLPLIVVDEPVAALQRLAASWRDRLDVTVVGITGSVGKTSTKEVVAAVLSERYRTYRSPGNLNNEIGLPLSLLELDPTTEVAVLEMGGAYASGELALLASLAKPRIAVVTNIFPVHLERMGTIEAIAETKAELVDAVPADGVAVLNGDDPRVLAMAGRCRGKVVTYGLDAGNDVRATEVVTEALEGTSFWLHLPHEEQVHVKVPLVGGHAVSLALAAIAVGQALRLHISEMLVGFNDPSVQVRLLVQPGPRGSRIIDDTYNASTPSALSALGLLESLHPRRAIAVLGDMRELGSIAEEEHRVVGRRAGEVADLIVTYGDLARLIGEEARGVPGRVDGQPPDVTSFALDERGELVDFLLGELRDGDVVLLKGSRGLRMEEMVVALRADAGGAVEESPSAGASS
jgi:UDP-N-acetylmuramoyl-tripeptide--D-alanyl-D-alanine ligase